MSKLVLAKTKKKKKNRNKEMALAIASVNNATRPDGGKRHDVTFENQKLLETLKQVSEIQQHVVNKLGTALASGNGSAETVQLLGQLRDLGISHAKMGRFMNIALGQIFQYLKEKWPKLPKSFRQAYDDEYYTYIQETYNLGHQMADMYACVWDVYYSGTYKVVTPGYVNLSDISIVKLYTASSYVVDGKMTDARWKALADTTLTRQQLSYTLKGAGKDAKAITGAQSKKDSKRAKFYRESGDVVMFVGGNREEVGHFNIESSNPVVLSEIRRILIMANIYHGR